MGTGKLRVSVRLDTLDLCERLRALFQAGIIPEDGFSKGFRLSEHDIFSLRNYIILTDASSANSAGDIIEMTFKVEVGGFIDVLAAAIRAGNVKRNCISHDQCP